MSRADGIVLQFGAFHLASGIDLLFRGSEVVPLEPRAVRVLRYLVEHEDRVLSKEELLEEVWSDVFTTDGVLKKAVSQIRRTLGDDVEQSRFITTYHGRGYRFIAPVTRVGSGAPKVVVAPAEVVPDAVPPPLPNYDQLAAREAELLTLRAGLRSALEGAPRPVAIIGEAGIGKTQLVRHFRRWAVGEGAVSLYGRFFDYRGARLAPYELFLDLLRTAVVHDKAPGGASLRDSIESACGVRLPAELFEDPSRVDAIGGGNAGDQFRFIVPICRAWLALSQRQPLVLVLDDLQWADPASLDVLGCLMRMLDTEPLMLIAIIRADEAENPEHPVHTWLAEQAGRRAFTTVRLQRLDEGQCRDVIGRIFALQSDEVPRGELETLFRLTGGNPYFLVETLRHLVAAGAIAPDRASRRWEWNGVRDVSLPETIRIAARAKVDRLPPRVRSVVEKAAVIGEEFHVATLCSIGGVPEAEVEEVLSEGVRYGVLSIEGLTPGEDCRFQHSILRHVVYDAIPPRRRRELHARTAAAIEAVYGTESERVAEALAAHYTAAFDLRRAFDAGMRAWRAASGRSEWRKAVALIERVEETSRQLTLGTADRLELLLALGESWRVAGRIRESAAVLDRAVSMAMPADDPLRLGRALYLRGLSDIALSNYPAARVSLTQALDLFLDRNAPAVSRTLVQLAAVEAATGNYERAASLVEDLRASQPSSEIVALADGIMGWSLALRGSYAEGAVLLERALEYQDRAGAIRERALLLRRLHWTHLSRGEYETAIQLAIRSRTDSETVGDANAVAKANMGIGQAHLAQGRHDEAVSYLTRAIDQLQTIGDAHCEAECLWLLGRARCETNKLDESAALLDRALTMIRQIGDRDDEFRILTDMARLKIAYGEFDAARDCASAARDIARSLSNQQGVKLAEAELVRAGAMLPAGACRATTGRSPH